MEISVHLADGLCLGDLLLRHLAAESMHQLVPDFVAALVAEQLDGHPDSRVCMNPECNQAVYPVLEIAPGSEDGTCVVTTRPCDRCPVCGGLSLRAYEK